MEKIYPWSDIDLRVVIAGENPRKPVQEIEINNIVFEVAYRGSADFSNTEAVLTNIRNYDVAFAPILFDRDGKLSEIQKSIKDTYATPHWLVTRASVSFEISQFLESRVTHFIAERNFNELGNFINIWLSALCQVVVVLKNRSPSLRGLLPRARDSLIELGYPELYDDVLRLFGSNDKTKEEVKEWLKKAREWYDIAIQRNDSQWTNSDLKPLLKNYWIDGTSHLIENGEHREAILPILVVLFQLNPVLGEIHKDNFELIWTQFKEWLGYGAENILSKYNAVQELSHTVRTLLENQKLTYE